MTGKYRFIFRFSAITLLLMLSAGLRTAGVRAAESLRTAVSALKKATAINDQLRVLDEAAARYATELETGGWELSFLRAPAKDLPKDLVPTLDDLAAMDAADWTMADFAEAKFICLYNDRGTLRLLGDFQIRLPEANRAATAEEADAVLYLVHRGKVRNAEPGNPHHRPYQVYIFRRDGHACVTPLPAGADTQTGKATTLTALWTRTRPWLYGGLDLHYKEGTATYRVTGNTCALTALKGAFTRYEVPADAEGYQVTGIEKCDNSTLEELTLPEGVTWIGDISCKKLRVMNFPSTLRRITGRVNTSVMERVALNEGLEEIGDFSLQWAYDEQFTLPSTLRAMGRGTLQYGASCSCLIIPEGITALPDSFLMDAPRLLSVYIPASVTVFGSDMLNYGRTHIFAPEGSPAAAWAESEGFRWTPCASAADMPLPYYGVENGFEYAIIADEAMLTGYTGSDEYVRVPERLGGHPVRIIEYEAFDQNNVPRSIVFPESVTLVRNYFATYCGGLTTVYLPASVTQADLSAYWQDEFCPPECTLYVPEGSPLAQKWAASETPLRWAVWTPGMEQPPAGKAFAWDAEQSARLQTPGATVVFGRMELDENTKNGPEDVEWTVLAAEEDRSLLIARQALFNQPFDNSPSHPASMSWGTSTLRDWLQTECIDTMFTRSERAMILAEQHGSLSDKIFLLSIGEADQLFDRQQSRQCALYGDRKQRPGQWWLRTNGASRSNSIAYVDKDGAISYAGLGCGASMLIRPAIWVRHSAPLVFQFLPKK